MELLPWSATRVYNKQRWIYTSVILCLASLLMLLGSQQVNAEQVSYY
jgi:hypothetical protein